MDDCVPEDVEEAGEGEADGVVMRRLYRSKGTPRRAAGPGRTG